MFKLKLCQELARSCINSPTIFLRIRSVRNISRTLKVNSSSSLPNSTLSSQTAWGASDYPNTKSEQEFLVRMRQDPDSFGESRLYDQELTDEGDILEEKYFTEKPTQSQRLSTKKYADLIKGFIRDRKIKEAIDVLEVRMLQEDKVKPENYIYNLLLGACGRVGYTKKAFMLYNDMKKRGLTVHISTYTSLFNACANSPWAEDGLTRAKHLYNIIIEKGIEPNDTNYNAMIKAFGRCGDLPMAFSLVDEMQSKGFKIKDDTFNFLIQSCISDKEAGFRHCLLVWKKLLDKHISPSLYTFNLMLRCIRDCNMGDLENTKDVINRLTGEPCFLNEASKNLNLIEESQKEDYSSHIVTPAIIEKLKPNLLARKPHFGTIISFEEIKNPEDRLILVGGFRGFLQTMMEYKCTPDIKTLTLLMESAPNTLMAEKEVLGAMRKLNIKPDIDFYNILIKKRILRSDYDEAKQVLTSIKQAKMRPNLITYGVLSMGCTTKEEALNLIDEMQGFSYTVNAAILGAMLRQACFHKQFDYILEIMDVAQKEHILVNKKFLSHLDQFKKKFKYLRDQKKLSKKEVKMFEVFKSRYKTWLTEVQMDELEDVHPWQQYRQTTPGDVKYKPKDGARFKTRHQSAFKVKTSTKHRY
ncbi:pentatricopeptide repeat-containing protein 1, mitochondrial [Euwallacea fornicatus]|uniref:pentatricopeptide repeat-containing protein 1, mitochondrial n=1 Tax=Euwallacea fornicatus TaxID=995702 RepID=UPI00338EBE5E